MNELALFAGAGGGILGGHLLGWRTVCAVEWEPYAACVLVARQNDGLLPPFPIWDDVQTFDGRPWRGIVDVISGGFPCQDISIAGGGDGLDGERSGMWAEMGRIIGEVRPRFAFVENSPMLTFRGLKRVLADLTSMGYDSRWGVVSAANVGANHRRERIWIVAHSKRMGWEKKSQESGKPSNKETSDFSSNGSQMVYSNGLRESQSQGSKQNKWRWSCDSSWWSTEPDVGRVAHGVAARMDRLKAIGNGQVPLCAATAWKLLTKGLEI
jgi:DNA (cytosine-5)-methyltransferase 1